MHDSSLLKVSVPSFDFPQAVREEFAAAIAQHGLYPLTRDDGFVYLAGHGFALGMADDFDEIRLSYAVQRPGGRWVVAPIRGALVDQLTAEDRVLGGRPQGRPEHVRAALRVFASGIANRRPELLAGDATWVDRLGRKESPRTGLWRELANDDVELLSRAAV